MSLSVCHTKEGVLQSVTSGMYVCDRELHFCFTAVVTPLTCIDFYTPLTH